MAGFVIKLADERGRIQEQVQVAGSAEELRGRFSQAGYYVYSVRPRSFARIGSRKKAKLEAFIVFASSSDLIKAGLPPVLGSLEMLAKGKRTPFAAGNCRMSPSACAGESTPLLLAGLRGDSP